MCLFCHLSCYLAICLDYPDDRIAIFFDIMALEFAQRLDDVVFRLSRKFILGRRMLAAASKKYKVMTVKAKAIIDEASTREDTERYLMYHGLVTVKHERERKSLFHRKTGIEPWIRDDFFKGVWLANLFALIIGVTIIAQRQNYGHYRCNSVSVAFGDSVWRKALIRNHTDPEGGTFEQTLVYSYFNGVYVSNGTYNGYPRYTEQNKIDGSAFHDTIPAEIVYCKEEERWVFTHQDIVKSNRDIAKSECAWLFRSAKTREYNLVDVPSDSWSGWTGVVLKAVDFSILCNMAERETSCNYHGSVSKDGLCECYDGYNGIHCEFEKPCTYMGEDYAVDVSARKCNDAPN